MMFDLRLFIKMGLMDAVGKLADYQVILNAAGWHEKGVLTTEDLADIQTAIESQYMAIEVPEDPIPEEPVPEEIPEEV